jgi:hypothetical protein
LYEFDIEDILNDIRDVEKYFDPYLYKNLIEIIFDCNIYFFRKTEVNDLMILPRYTKNRIDFKKDKNCVIIYEHLGGISDNAEYPQCEYIIGVNNLEISKHISVFEYDSNPNIICRNIYDELYNSYVLNSKNNYISPKIFFDYENIELKYQYIDEYGKCRLLYINYKNKIYTFIISPCPVIKCPITYDPKIIKQNYEDTSDLLLYLNVNIYNQIIYSKKDFDQNISRGINFNIGNIDINILIEDMELDKRNNIETIAINENINSELEIYNKSKRNARYLKEYFFWLYAKKYTDNIDDFINKNILFDENVYYENVPKIFSMKNNDMFKFGKLILQNEEVLKRLLYLLNLSKHKILEKYSKIIIMDEYYKDISDFIISKNEIIIYGLDSLLSIIENDNKKIIFDSVQPENKNPYYFKNNIIDNENIFLAYNTNDLNIAINIGIKWYEDKYLDIENNDKTEHDINFNFYSYENHKNIEKYNIKGSIILENYKINIIGYKYKETKYFTILLY